MKKIDKKLFLEIIALILFLGAVLFFAVNTKEAKVLFDYVVVILKPFIYGFCIAYVINLLSKQFDNMFKKHAEKKGKEYNIKKHRNFSIFASVLVFIAFAALAIGMVIPNLKDTVVSLYKQAPELWEKFLGFLNNYKEKQPKLAGLITSVEDNLDSYFDKAVNYVKNNLSNIATTAVDKIKSATNVLANFGIGLVVAYIILLYKEELVKEMHVIFRRFLPDRGYNRVCYVLNLTNKKFQIFLKYNIVQAVITGAGTLLFMIVTGMPYKVSISLLITVTQLVPIIGAIVGTVVSALLIAAISPIKAIIFCVLCIIVQQLVEKLINPHLMGKELEMPGLLTFLVVILGGKQFGLVGLICSVPLASVCYDIYTLKLRQRIHNKAKKKTKTEEIQE